MTNQIQPYSMIQKTNIKEHNDMVNKINEIVDVINNTNLDTINAEISGLKAKATATDTEIANIKNKDATQDTEIDGVTKNLVSNVTATFDNPSRELKISLGREASPSIDATVVIPASSETGQYSAGNGITIENYQIAVDTGVVALKTDIPVVPDVSGITNRLDTIDGEITGINTDITNITNKNTEQDTAINGKVAIAQGTENAGKVLGIGTDGNVTPVNAGGGSGGEVWEEVDLSNWPSDWVAGDKIKFIFNGVFTGTQWIAPNWLSSIIEIELPEYGNAHAVILSGKVAYSGVCMPYIETVYGIADFNRGELMNLKQITIKVDSIDQSNSSNLVITSSNIATYFKKMWRLKKA